MLEGSMRGGMIVRCPAGHLDEAVGAALVNNPLGLRAFTYSDIL